MIQRPPPVFVMVADVCGSAGLYERLNDREAARAIERCVKRMNRSLEAYGGETLQLAGDEMLALFTSGEAACQAAINMQQRLAALPPVTGLKLGLRIGLHAGESLPDSKRPPEKLLDTTARIAGLAHSGQILCSNRVVNALKPGGVVKVLARLDQAVKEDNRTLDVFQIEWPAQPAANQMHSMFGPFSTLAIDRLRLRYQGEVILLDEHNPIITLGRDPSSQLLIEDRKASRQHARIERRHEGYYLVDTSTNGSFVRVGNRQAVAVRRGEMLLEGAGVLSFGSNLNDPGTEKLAFDHC
ncbi:MAG: adenylate/guanylate cyclase domain-containing protein [Azonexus sp.]|nr:adenylate/guanylate cyclase domain-containing protein [Azonexus sp.]